MTSTSAPGPAPQGSQAGVPDGPPVDPFDPDRVLRATGLLARFNAAGVLAAADVHAARRIAGLVQERDELVQLALALTIRALRHGSVCIDLDQVADQDASADESPLDPQAAAELPWPDPARWRDLVRASPLVASEDDPRALPLRLRAGLLYLDKYWRQEQVVATQFDLRTGERAPAPAPSEDVAAAIGRLFTAPEEGRQRVAALAATQRRGLIVAGGPGTGKTTAVAKILAVLADRPGPPPRIALAAPTGKAAARLGDAVRESVSTMSPQDRARLGQLQALTVHRLLGWRPGNQVRHHADAPLGYDVVVVDEASMLSLTMMARLLAALRQDCILLLVGDPDQLESVDAGVVLADLVDRARHRAETGTGLAETGTGLAGGESAGEPGAFHGLGAVVQADLQAMSAPERRLAEAGVVTLRHRFRFGEQAEIVALADAIVAGDPERVIDVLRTSHQQVHFLDLAADHGPEATPDEAEAGPPTPWSPRATGLLAEIRQRAVLVARQAHQAAVRGDIDQALTLLGSHQVLCAHRHGPFGATTWSRQLEEWARSEIPGYLAGAPWYPGRPVLVRANDPELGIYNGDTGIVVRTGAGPMVAFGSPGRVRLVTPARLADLETVHALTIHKSQGSQYDGVTLVLPPLESPLLTRELLYTAVTRARLQVRLVGTLDAVRVAVSRPVTRASGLRIRAG